MYGAQKQAATRLLRQEAETSMMIPQSHYYHYLVFGTILLLLRDFRLTSPQLGTHLPNIYPSLGT